MNYLTICSGIGAPEAAWNPLGWNCVAQSEIDKFPSAVLKHHYPDVPNLGDMQDYKNWPDYDIDILCGGTPCQAFSVAGLRRSLQDDRGNLTLTFIRIANRYNPKYTVWENVPGVLNTPDNAFGQFLSGLTGYDTELHPAGGRWTNAGFIVGPKRIAAWRILDAQHFGVPQRRRRVFVIASPREFGFAPCQILFEPESLQGDIKKGRETGQEVARSLRGQPQSSHREDSDNFIIVHARQDPISIENKALPLDTKGNSQAVAFRAFGQEGFTAGPIAPPVCATDGGAAGMPTVCISGRARGDDGRGYSRPEHITENVTPCLDTVKPHRIVGPNSIVRRLIPIECERLQGFPDDFTKIPYRNKPADKCPDGPRYKALGNSMAVPVLEHIGKRIQLYEEIND